MDEKRLRLMEIRLECLKIAASREITIEALYKTAENFYEYCGTAKPPVFVKLVQDIKQAEQHL